MYIPVVPPSGQQNYPCQPAAHEDGVPRTVTMSVISLLLHGRMS